MFVQSWKRGRATIVLYFSVLISILTNKDMLNEDVEAEYRDASDWLSESYVKMCSKLNDIFVRFAGWNFKYDEILKHTYKMNIIRFDVKGNNQ